MNKTIKRNVLVSAVLAIALCVSLIAGATFALFTSESKVNVAVTSGKVSIVAKLDESSVKTKQLYKDYEDYTDDEDHTYAQGVEFSADGSSLTITNMVPGDGVKFDIVIENSSTVTVKYRTILACNTYSDLVSGLEVKIDDVRYRGTTIVSNYNELREGEQLATISVSIELPAEAGNEYQDKAFEFFYQIDAIQGNAQVDEPESGEHRVYVNNAADWMAFVEGAHTAERMTYAMRSTAAVSESDDVTSVELINDIDLAGIDYGAYYLNVSGKAFKIIGNNHTIRNLTTTASDAYNGFNCSGLFACVSENGSLTVKDLNIENATVIGSSDPGSIAGVFIGQARAAAVSFDNCHIVESSTTSCYAAGFIGYIESFYHEETTIKNSSVEDCEFNGNDATAALIGLANAGVTLDIDSVTVKGNTVDGGNGYSAAAMVGTAQCDFAATNVTLENNTYTIESSVYDEENAPNTPGYTLDNIDIGYVFSSNGYVIDDVPYVGTFEQFDAQVKAGKTKVVLAANIVNGTVPHTGGTNAYDPYRPTDAYTIKAGKELTVDFSGHIFTAPVRLFYVEGNATLNLINSDTSGAQSGIYFNKTDSDPNYAK